MFKILMLLLISSTLSGCIIDFNEKVSKNKYPHNKSDFDLVNIETGLKVKFLSNYVQEDISIYDMAWEYVQTCTGLSASPAPYIIIVPGDNLQGEGKFFVSDKTIQVEEYYDIYLDSQVLRHEMIHFLLDANGVTDAQNTEHLSTSFVLCTYYLY